MNADFLGNILLQNEITLDGGKIEQLAALADMLVEFNSHTNITSITTEIGIAVRHIADSLLALKYIGEAESSGKKLLDIGAGGGFPSLPIAIARPELFVTALDSTAKKLDFVTEAAAKLGIKNIDVLPGRAEVLIKTDDRRECYDFVCARAVARLNVLCELCIPYTAMGGKFIALKGPDAEAELTEAKKAFGLLGCNAPKAESFILRGEEEEQSRTIVTAVKTAHTPNTYPRIYQAITKKPL